MTTLAAESATESVEGVLMRYFRDEATVAHAHAALLHEWQEMGCPGSHGPAMLSLTKWIIRNAAREANRQLDERTLYQLLEPLGSLFKRE